MLNYMQGLRGGHFTLKQSAPKKLLASTLLKSGKVLQTHKNSFILVVWHLLDGYSAALLRI